MNRKLLVVGLALTGLGVIEFAAFCIGNAQYMNFIEPNWVEPDIQNTQWWWVPTALGTSFMFLVSGFCLVSVCAYNRLKEKSTNHSNAINDTEKFIVSCRLVVLSRLRFCFCRLAWGFFPLVVCLPLRLCRVVFLRFLAWVFLMAFLFLLLVV